MIFIFGQTFFKSFRKNMETIVKGGTVPAFRLSANRIIHYFGDSVEVTDNDFRIVEKFVRVGRWFHD